MPDLHYDDPFVHKYDREGKDVYSVSLLMPREGNMEFLGRLVSACLRNDVSITIRPCKKAGDN